MPTIRAIIGLGNPGPEYELTRHNAGALWVAHLAARHGQKLRQEKRFAGLYQRIEFAGQDLHLLCPGTYMNRSGQAVLALAQFYKFAPAELLVAHDDLDLPIGAIRLKKGGGHGGHNGLRDIIQCLGESQAFPRVRFGIGHPGHKERVHGHVLGRLSDSERHSLDEAFSRLDQHLDAIITGNWDAAMNRLHSGTQD